MFTRTIEDGDCWTYVGSKTHNGYGRVKNEFDQVRMAHRVVYEYMVAEIPADLVLDHLCRNRACVNPEHLEPVTQKINLARGLPRNKPRDFCVKGHDQKTHRVTYSSGSKCAVCQVDRRKK